MDHKVSNVIVGIELFSRRESTESNLVRTRPSASPKGFGFRIQPLRHALVGDRPCLPAPRVEGCRGCPSDAVGDETHQQVGRMAPWLGADSRREALDAIIGHVVDQRAERELITPGDRRPLDSGLRPRQPIDEGNEPVRYMRRNRVRRRVPVVGGSALRDRRRGLWHCCCRYRRVSPAPAPAHRVR